MTQLIISDDTDSLKVVHLNLRSKQKIFILMISLGKQPLVCTFAAMILIIIDIFRSQSKMIFKNVIHHFCVFPNSFSTQD